jgi:hypothetical protein
MVFFFLTRSCSGNWTRVSDLCRCAICPGNASKKRLNGRVSGFTGKVMAGSESSERGSMGLLKALVIYVICLFALLMLFNIVEHDAYVPRWAGVLGYFLIGIILNIVVLRRLIEWHPVYDTIGNVSSAKLSTIAFWPVSYPILYFKLFVAKYL